MQKERKNGVCDLGQKIHGGNLVVMGAVALRKRRSDTMTASQLDEGVHTRHLPLALETLVNIAITRRRGAVKA